MHLTNAHIARDPAIVAAHVKGGRAAAHEDGIIIGIAQNEIGMSIEGTPRPNSQRTGGNESKAISLHMFFRWSNQIN